MSYFNLDLRRDQMPTQFVHTLNRQYKGAQKFTMRAPGAEGTLIIWARDLEEANEHAINALFELIFRGAHKNASATNPRCPYCRGRSQRHGLNSSGKRSWKCQSAECGRYFVLDRVWKGGINHPVTQSKKPEFVRLLLSGVTVAEAADRLKLNHSTAGNWAERVAENNPEAMAALRCGCGKPLRHRGSCSVRLAKHLKGKALAAAAAARSTRAHANGGFMVSAEA